MPESQPLQFNLEVPADGRIEVQAPLLAGASVTVFVTEQLRSDSGDLRDLLDAAASSTDFWNNPFDEEWNNA